MGWFFKKKKDETIQGPVVTDLSFLGCDMHSHLVPRIDDGAQTPEDSLALIRGLQENGYSRLITTPHIHVEFFNNQIGDVREKFAALKQLVADAGIDIGLDIAAEYYLDEFFELSVLPQGLLSFGDNYVLVEVSMAGWPRTFDDMIFNIQSRGYRPILAHPERYLFENDIKVYERLKSKGVLMQMNLLSISGYYGRAVREMAERYMAARLYDFCGSDTHHLRHVNSAAKLIRDQPALLQVLAHYGFRNSELLGSPGEAP